MRRLPPVHPLALAVYPVVFLYGENLGEASPGDLVAPLALVLGGTLVLYGLLRLVLGSATRAALAASLLVVAGLEYGRIATTLAGTPLSGGRLLVVLALATVLLLVLVVRTRRDLAGINRILDVLSIVLLAVASSGVLAWEVPRAIGSTPAVTAGGPAPSVAVGGDPATRTKRDIVYIVVEDIGSPRTLVRDYGLTDPHAFDWLDELGFRVADRSATNYGKTIHMLASTFNMTYLDELAAKVGTDSSDYHPLFDLVDDNAVARFLKGQGYRYIHIGSWWDPTEQSSLADVNYGVSTSSDFLSAFLDTTVVPEVVDRLPRLGIRLPAGVDPKGASAQYDGAIEGFRRLLEVRDAPGPKFVFAHILIPHEPFVFNEDGSRVTAAQTRSRTPAEQFLQQALYTNRRLEEIARAYVDRPEAERPILIIQTDEGPNPPRFVADEDTFDWRGATDEELQIKFGVLNAFFLPDLFDGDAAIEPTMTTVNTFRFVFDRYFGADLPLLPDRLNQYRDKSHPYDFTDVTERATPRE
ncbi:MAG TPA: hypothetical protein VFR93_09325 [Candidatus Limnocylindrales bacterium]|nr:hypothetical protein [Candidatus Limnocylindrales bacterium]